MTRPGKCKWPALAQQVPSCCMRAYIEKFAFNFRSKQVEDLLQTDLWHVWRFDRRQYSVNYDSLPLDRTSEINQWDEITRDCFYVKYRRFTRLTDTDIHNIRGKLDEEILRLYNFAYDRWMIFRIYSYRFLEYDFFKGRERIKFIVGFFLHENYFENNNFTLVCW